MAQPELRSEANDSGESGAAGLSASGADAATSLCVAGCDGARSGRRQIRGAIPEPQRIAAELPTIAEALEYLHRPPADADLKELQKGRSMGHRTLAFDELFGFELAMCIERERSARRPGLELRGAEDIGHRLKPVLQLTAKFIETIPFRMTGAQTRTLDEIARTSNRRAR